MAAADEATDRIARELHDAFRGHDVPWSRLRADDKRQRVDAVRDAIAGELAAHTLQAVMDSLQAGGATPEQVRRIREELVAHLAVQTGAPIAAVDKTPGA